MGDIIAPNGSPLSVAVIGVANMDASLAFYCDIIGLTASAPRIWDGEQFEKLWKLPPGTIQFVAYALLLGITAGIPLTPPLLR